MKRQTIFQLIIALSIIGLLTSMYLVQSHFVCDIGVCSVITASEFSELFNVPVAIFGVIWFIILILMAWQKFDLGMLIWNIVGFLFVIYMVLAEIILKALCPFCTILHIIILITLILSIIVYKPSKKYRIKRWFTLIIILNLIPLIYFNGFNETNYDNIAKCLSTNDLKMYSSITCSVCQKQKEYFGDSFQYINEVECNPNGENPQTGLCTKKGIEAIPTWIFEKDGVEVQRVIGFQTPEFLAELTGCIK